MERQALLIARWMHVGLVHGVMNTDNTALSGETIDFGPCAFMDSYDPATAFSAIDEFGRYAYADQPTIAQWNLARFAETLLPLLDPNPERAVELASEAISADRRLASSTERSSRSTPTTEPDGPTASATRKGDVTRPRAEVKHAHARPDAAFPGQSARESFDTQRLQLQALEFGLGPWIKVRPVPHERTPP